MNIQYKINAGDSESLIEHLNKCDFIFVQGLTKKIGIADYVDKIINNATRFEAWKENELVGLIAAYFNDINNHSGYITNVSTIASYEGKGIGKELLNNCIQFGKENNYIELNLEVFSENKPAIHLYEKCHFKIKGFKNDQIIMNRDLTGNILKS